MICHCMSVDRRTIEAAIAAGATTVEDLQDATRACTGCGTCRWDLLELLARSGVPAYPRPEAS